MKSAIGIGALLMDGLGDTIRVSLTEDPELEMEPCRCRHDPLILHEMAVYNVSEMKPTHKLCGFAFNGCSELLTGKAYQVKVGSQVVRAPKSSLFLQGLHAMHSCTASDDNSIRSNHVLEDGQAASPRNSLGLLGARCRQLAGLGQAACSGQWGVEAFRNESRDILDFARRTGRLPEQRDGDDIDFRSILHRDGSVLSAPTISVSSDSPRHCISHCISGLLRRRYLQNLAW